MTIDHEDDVAGLRRAGRAVAEARDTMLQAAQPGVSTLELDAIGREVLGAHGARSAPQLAYDFPGTTCISVNDEIAHGIPSERRLVDGDLVNIDVSAELDGYWADTGASTSIGIASPEIARLLKTANEHVATPSMRLAPAVPSATSGGRRRTALALMATP